MLITMFSYNCSSCVKDINKVNLSVNLLFLSTRDHAKLLDSFSKWRPCNLWKRLKDFSTNTPLEALSVRNSVAYKGGIFTDILDEKYRRKRNKYNTSLIADVQAVNNVPGLVLRACTSGTVTFVLCQPKRTWGGFRTCSNLPSNYKNYFTKIEDDKVVTFVNGVKRNHSGNEVEFVITCSFVLSVMRMWGD